jgi:U3 small nucleolar RNA-associated protein 10
VSEELLEQLLPYIIEGLSADSCPDYRAATLMMLAELCTRTPLSNTFLSGLMKVQGLDLFSGVDCM